MGSTQKYTELLHQCDDDADGEQFLPDKIGCDEGPQGDQYLGESLAWRQKLRSTLLSRRSLLEFVLILAIIWLIPAWLSTSKCHTRHEVVGDLTEVFPKFSQKVVTFTHDPDFVPEDGYSFFTNETKQKWLDIVPKGLGWIKVKHPQKYHDLPEPIEDFGGPDQAVFTTSVTHQLHCLYGIAEVYSALKSDPSLAGDRMAWHVDHCFDYLRQSIMCAGDLAIEGQEKTFPDGVTGSDGWDGKHICRDYNEVYHFLDEHAAIDKHWI